MSNRFRISYVQIPDPKLDIRNSQRVIHTEPNQLLASTSFETSNIHDDCPDGRYRGSFRPASGALSEANSVPLVLEFLLADDLLTASWNDWSLSATGSDGDTKVVVVEHVARPELAKTKGGRLVAVNFKPQYAAENFPWGFAGDVIWTLTVDGKEFVDGTRLEIYALTDTLPAFYHGVVDVQFLRAMVLPARAAPKLSWSQYVVDAAFSKFGFKYDITNGDMKYAGGALHGSYDLQRWVRGINKGNLVNCYDQAGIVLIATGLGPKVHAEWMYMEPFGFIAPTTLVGYPGVECNNPFGKTADNLFVDNNLNGRTYFRNHAFARIDGLIADACARPHRCEETLEAYIAVSIQPKAAEGFVDTSKKTTNAYWHSDVKPNYHNPGTKDDANPYTGVTALNGCDILPPQKLDKTKPTPNTITAMQIARQNVTDTSTDTTTYALPLSKLDGAIRTAASSTTDQNPCSTSLDVSLNAQGLEANWDISHPTQRDTEIGVYICRDNAYATRMFENDLHHSTMPWASSLEKPADVGVYGGDVLGQVMLASKEGEAQAGLVRWVRGQVVVNVTGPAAAGELFRVWGKVVDEVIRGCGAVEEGEGLGEPSVKGDLPVAVGRGVKFEVEITCDFDFEHYSYVDLNVEKNMPQCLDLVVLLHAKTNGRSLVVSMRATEEAGTHTLQFVFAEKDSSRVVAKNVDVEIQ